MIPRRNTLGKSAQRQLTFSNCFGAGRIPRDEWPDDALDRRAKEMLYRSLNVGTTVAFVGAGLSAGVGYPDWKQLVRLAIDEMRKNSPQGNGGGSGNAAIPTSEIDALNNFLEKPGAEATTKYMFVLGEVKRLYELLQLGSSFPVLISEAMANPNRNLCGPGALRGTYETHPFAALCGLPITRFVTTNYDCELELQLAQPVQHPVGENNVHRRGFGWTEGGYLVSAPGTGLTDGALIEPCSWALEAGHSFTQLKSDTDRLAEFVLASRRAKGEELIFHCHGRCDIPGSMILTEEDYQNWYLERVDREKLAFQHTIELLLGSNPILFLGYGFKDADLLRSLRMFSASEPQYKDSRQLFVAIPKFELIDPISLDMRARFSRYGAHVIPFEVTTTGGGAGPQPHDRTEGLVRFMNDLRKGWCEWQTAWIQKPCFREYLTPRSEEAILWHYGFWSGGNGNGDDNFDDGTIKADIEWLREQVATGPSSSPFAPCFVLLGGGGSGKSHRAVKLLRDYVENGKKEFEDWRGVFWSSYYADDWLTGIDATNEHLYGALNGGNKPTVEEWTTWPRLRKLAYVLKHSKAVLVFDGFERVLMPTGEADIGKTYNSQVRRFLEVIAAPRQGAAVILTSRLWPMELGNLKLARHEEEKRRNWSGGGRHIGNDVGSDSAGHHAPQGTPAASALSCTTTRTDALDPPKAHLLTVGPIRAANLGKQPHLQSLCSLLAGHAYALAIAGKALSNWNENDRGERIRELERRLQRAGPGERASRMIIAAIDEFDEDLKRKTPFARGFLERIALFMSPVDEACLEVCYGEALRWHYDMELPPNGRAEAEDNIGILCDNLVQRRLLFEIVSKDGGAKSWTMHPTVRGCVFHRLHHARSGELPNFTLAGFTTGVAAVDPGDERAGRIVTDLLIALINKACESQGPDAVGLARAAFSLFRSRFEATTAARWCRYDEYVRHSIRLLNLVKKLSGELLWSFADSRSCAGVASPEGILHAEELAWLYNDLGLALCCEGNMHDALAIWEQGYAINRVIEAGEVGGQFTVQSLLHLSHTYLERGRIDLAEQYLRETKQANSHQVNPDFAGRILGYSGLLNHLRGAVRLAEKDYDQSLRVLRKVGGNSRAESIFLQHYADLKIMLGQAKEAGYLLRQCRALAETGDHPDLVAYARNSVGHLHRVQGQPLEARREYTAALADSRRMGIRRLEADVLSELSHLALDQGDPESARLRAMESMRIANELGLGLRQCHGLVVLGRASLLAEQRDLGEAYLRVAHRLCRVRGYWLRAQEAETELRRLNIDPL